jgi:chromosome segregation protein
MRLRSLEIKGFKSFANETLIHFNDDVTGIVGPNGSGKSNIVDAVRWVLGEQKSSQLRLDKMASVIFNGTKKRKEGQMAQVTLNFDNTKNVLPTEYTSVSVSRILYRSGESEYRLNGVACRLKDITSLLLDTGIGPDSYAIIALNMVEDMLSDREQARRRMFEQAAGVSKYKTRKHETRQKLDATAADLERVEDLLFEIEDQLKKLEKQAQRTRKFYEIKEEYKKNSIELAVHNLARHKKNYRELEGQITREEDEYRKTEASARLVEADIESKRKQHTDKETSLSEQQQEVNRLTGRIRGKENEKSMLAQKETFVRNDLRRLEDQMENARRQLATLDAEIEGYQTDLNYERNVEGDLEEALKTAQARLEKVRADHQLLKGDLDAFIKAQQTLEREIVDLEKQRAIQSTQVEGLRRDVERTMSDIAVRRVEMQSLEVKLAEQEKAEAILRERIAALDAAEQKRKTDMTAAEQQQESLVKELTLQNRQLDARRNEFKLTKSMIESLEGFPESIQFLSRQKDWAKDCPLLSDLIYVQEAYRVAIETYLEPCLNYYVVPTVEKAVEAIGLLGKAQKGRANFFILEAFQDYEPPLALFAEGISATDVVQTDPAYRALIAFLLENVILESDLPVQQLAHVLPPAAGQGREGARLSVNGTVIRRRFSMSGGSIGLFEGKKIGRKKNLELLEAEIKQLEGAEQQLNSRLATVRTHLNALKMADQSAHLQREREALNRQNQETARLRATLDNISAFVANFDTQAGNAHQRIETLTVANVQIDRQLEEKQALVEQARSRLTNTDGSFREVADLLSQASQTYNQQNIEFIRQQNKVNTFRQELTFREKRRSELQQVMGQSQTARIRNGDEVQLIVGDLARLEQDLTAAYAEKKSKEAALGAAEQVYFKARNEIHELENRQRDNFRRQQDLQVAVNRLKEKFSDVKFEITAIGERLRAEFSMGVNDIINIEPDPQYDRDVLEKEVNSLKRRIDTYGEINPLAIEAYNEIKERYDTISAQRADILSAKENLVQTIKEIEETATARFLESFTQVRENFIQVFRTLFTEEDTADLVLTKPDEPLESDINIIAKPKGKRPQTIAQLSGGEKTLTATALLFALYLLKPAPFCIFDEVDAPLDDANIDKFNKIIRQFSKESQFIVVTHNKATMTAVDTIYGVYMPEQGVSSVTPVDFRKLGNEAMVFEAT